MLAGLPIRSVGGWVLPRACHWTRTEANAAKVRRGGSRKEEDNEDGRGTGEGDGGDGGHTGSETYTIGSTLPGRRYVARYVDVSQPSTQPLLVQYRSLKSRLAWCDARTAALRASASSAVSTRLARFGALDGSPASIGPLRRLELSAGPVRASNRASRELRGCGGGTCWTAVRAFRGASRELDCGGGRYSHSCRSILCGLYPGVRVPAQKTCAPPTRCAFAA